MKTKDQIGKDLQKSWKELEEDKMSRDTKGLITVLMSIDGTLVDIRDLLHKQIVGNTVEEQGEMNGVKLEEVGEPTFTDAPTDQDEM